ncbi:hypothetical protein FJZ26_02735 [Candidatus Parvarchaeota archaeon]|nr:hypothetical protein [Candidatus Parvarchaeota archaeon]
MDAKNSDAALKEPTGLIERIVKDGGVYALLYFDMYSNDQAQLQNALVGFIAKLNGAHGVKYVYGEVDKPVQAEQLWSTTAEVKVLAVDFRSLAQLCSLYGPLGIEILKPNEINLRLSEAQSMLLDVSTMLKEMNAQLVNKVLDEKQRAEYEKRMAQRAALGKQLMEKMKRAEG